MFIKYFWIQFYIQGGVETNLPTDTGISEFNRIARLIPHNYLNILPFRVAPNSILQVYPGVRLVHISCHTSLKIQICAEMTVLEPNAIEQQSNFCWTIERNYHFVSFSVEKMGPLSWRDEGKMMALKTDEPRSKSFLKQRISMTIGQCDSGGSFLFVKLMKFCNFWY